MGEESAPEGTASVARVPIIRVDEVVRSWPQARLPIPMLKGLHILVQQVRDDA